MKRRLCLHFVLLTISISFLGGCGSGGKLSTGQGSVQPQQPLGITNGAQLTVACGQSITLSADYGSSPATSITWSESPTAGSISTSGVYTAPLAVPTNPLVTVTATDPNTKQRATISVSIVNPVPKIAAASSTVISPGATTTLVINGSGFTPASTVMLDGKPEPTTYSSPTSLSFSMSAPSWASASSGLTVANPQPGGGTSNSIILTYQQSAISYNAAARFLQQATWGATPSMINHVQQVGFSAFLDEQLAAAPQSNVVDNNSLHFVEVFWGQIATNDVTQLRTKTMWAWYKLYNPPGNSILWIGSAVPELLNRDAFANYKTIFTDVSFNMEMGMYLNYCCTDAAGAEPNENFGRESMQQFTIGPHLLNRDGTPVLSADGTPTPSYSQDDIEGISRAITGLGYPADIWSDNDTEGLIPMGDGNPGYHDSGSKTILGQTIPGGQDVKADLLDVVNILASHPNTGVHLSTYLIHEFVTSNPSPAYVARVASVWANNGAGVSGDISAVLKAILLDPEARAGDDSPSSVPQAFGRFRDIPNFAAAFMRLLCALPGCTVDGGAPWSLSTQAHEMTFYAPSVFGYYSDNFTIPNTTTLAPEMQLYAADSIAARAAFLYNVLYLPPGFDPLLSSIDWTQWAPLASGDGSQLIDLIDHVGFHGAMSAELYQALQQNLESIPASNPVERAKQTLYLSLISPEFAVEH